MLRKVTWRAWAVPVLLLAAAIVLGLTWEPGGPEVDWIYKIGTLGASFTPLILAGIYTVAGLRGEWKWWQNDLGTALIQLDLAIPVIAGPLAWAIWLNAGSITGGMVAWLEIAGPLLVTCAILNLCWVFLRYHQDGKEDGKDASEQQSA